MLQKDIEAYIKEYNIYLASKIVCYKPYKNLQLLSILIYEQKDIFIDFIIGLLVLTNWIDESYDFILIIINCQIKIIFYKLVKIIIDISKLAKFIIDIVIYHDKVLESIITN